MLTSGIVHVAAVVVVHCEVGRPFRCLLRKLTVPARSQVGGENGDEVIAVIARVVVKQTQGVGNLMSHRVELNSCVSRLNLEAPMVYRLYHFASISDRDLLLLLLVHFSHEAVAALSLEEAQPRQRVPILSERQARVLLPELKRLPDKVASVRICRRGTRLV